jgi:phage shock protein PspC (stress-responsive transcriptional regulator)
MERRFYRSSTDRKLTGVSGGLAEYLDVEPVLVRIAWVIVAIFTGGAAILAYVALVFIMPLDEIAEDDVPEFLADEPEIDSEEGAAPAPSRRRSRRQAKHDPESESRRRLIGGVLLVLIGAVFLLNNFDVFGGVDFSRFWPLLIFGRLRGSAAAASRSSRYYLSWLVESSSFRIWA